MNTPTSRARVQPTLLELPLPRVRTVTISSKLILREASQVAMSADCPEMGTIAPRDAHDQMAWELRSEGPHGPARRHAPFCRRDVSTPLPVPSVHRICTRR